MPSRYGKITKEILWSLGESGRIALTGNSVYFAMRRWRIYHPKDTESERKKEQRKFSQAVWRLKKSRLVIVREEEDGKFLAEITEKGRRKLREFQFVELKIQKPKKWDGIWRIVIFDIPNKKSRGRDVLREKLKALEFYQLQKSVWAFPYPCEKEIEFLVELFDLYPFVHIIEAQKIKGDVRLRKHFGLL